MKGIPWIAAAGLASRRLVPCYGGSPVRRVGWIVVGLCVVSLTACGLFSPPGSGPCPEGWRAAVVFSTETGSSSELVFVGDGVELGRRSIPYRGLDISPGGGWSKPEGGDVWIAANGGVVRDSTHLLRFSTVTCGVRAVAVKEPVILAVAGIPDGVLSTNTLNFAAEIRKRDGDGQLLAEHRIGGVSLTVLLATPTRVFGLGHDFETEEAILVELDPGTLALRRRVPLPDTHLLGRGAVLRGSELFFTPAFTPTNVEGRVLGRLNVDTLGSSPIPLPQHTPYLLAEASDALYIGHTSMNPSSRPMAEYRYVSRYDLVTGETATFDVGGPLLEIGVDGKDLIVMTGETDVTVSRLDRITGERLSAVIAKAPTRGYFYRAGLIVAPPKPGAA